MASKYANVISSLPRFTDTKPDYQERVNVIKTEIRGAEGFVFSSSSLAACYASVRADKEALQEELSSVQSRLTALEQLMTDQFEAEGTARIVLATGESVSVQVEPYAQVVDKDANRVWAIANGMERLLSLPWQTVNKLTKDAILAGESEPDGVTCYAKTKIVLRRG